MSVAPHDGHVGPWSGGRTAEHQVQRGAGVGSPAVRSSGMRDMLTARIPPRTPRSAYTEARLNGCRAWTPMAALPGMHSALTHLQVRSLAVLPGALPSAPIRDEHSRGHSHSIVAGGFDEMSYTTRFTPETSLTIRLEIFARTSYGSFAQSAVIPSSDVTARIAPTFA